MRALIVIEADTGPPLARVPEYLPYFAGAGIDLFVYTASEIELMARTGNRFVAHALAESVPLIEDMPRGTSS